jgi:hypothetical protein
MAKKLRLYWLRETGCDAGTPINAEELDAPIRQRVMELTGKDRQEIALYLPFMDRRECRRRAEVSRAMKFERTGDAIRAIPATLIAELRDRAAMLVALHPAWRNIPRSAMRAISRFGSKRRWRCREPCGSGFPRCIFEVRPATKTGRTPIR